jgi:hypothetical protein
MTYKIAQWHKGTFSALDLEENEKNLVLPAERERGREERPFWLPRLEEA